MRLPFLPAVALITALLAPAPGAAQSHCSELPELTVDAKFPRCSEGDLVDAGFPDHKHALHWYGWQVPVTADGKTYGPGSLCERKRFLGHDDLVMLPGEKRFGQFILRHSPGYEDCDMLAFVEVLDWANHVVPELLGLTITDTLTVLNPDNTPDYKAQTGQGVWRLYKLDGNQVTIEPYPVLLARTLDAHAGFMLVTDWILNQALEQDLPPWLHQGLVEYLGENGTHLVNYMAEFRADGPVVFSGPLVDAILSRGVDPDEGTDREMYRRACYSAYLMTWQLVEFEGGLIALQDFLAQVAAGVDLDEASRVVYGMDLVQMADFVDPVRNGEPGGKAMKRQPRSVSENLAPSPARPVGPNSSLPKRARSYGYEHIPAPRFRTDRTNMAQHEVSRHTPR